MVEQTHTGGDGNFHTRRLRMRTLMPMIVVDDGLWGPCCPLTPRFVLNDRKCMSPRFYASASAATIGPAASVSA